VYLQETLRQVPQSTWILAKVCNSSMQKHNIS